MTKNGRISTAACRSAVANARPCAESSCAYAQSETTKKRQIPIEKSHVEQNDKTLTPHPPCRTNLVHIFIHKHSNTKVTTWQSSIDLGALRMLLATLTFHSQRLQSTEEGHGWWGCHVLEVGDVGVEKCLSEVNKSGVKRDVRIYLTIEIGAFAPSQQPGRLDNHDKNTPYLDSCLSHHRRQSSAVCTSLMRI